MIATRLPALAFARARVLGLGLALALAAQGTLGQGRPNPEALLSAQRDAIGTFAFLDGTWRGPATTALPTGAKLTLVQTERVGPFLGGSVRVIEGRGHDDQGRVTFNALGIISWDVAAKRFMMRSYAQGHAGDFPIERTADGFRWEIPAGPFTIRYVAVVRDGTWTETGDRIAPGKDPERFFEMTLKRVGDTDWPAAGAVPPR